MADDTNNSNLQQSAGSLDTGNPQSIPPAGLQNQSTTSLQPAGSQSFAGLSLLDQGGSAIALGGVSKTSSSSVQSVPVKATYHAKAILIYGGVGVISLAILVSMVYGLLRQR